MAVIKKTDDNECWGCGEKGLLARRWWEREMEQPLWNTSLSGFQKLNINLPSEPAVHAEDSVQEKWKRTPTPKKNWYVCIQGGITHNSQKLEAT